MLAVSIVYGYFEMFVKEKELVTNYSEFLNFQVKFM